MGDHLPGFRQLIGTFGALVVFLAPVWTAGSARHATLAGDAGSILQVAGPEAKGIRSYLSGLDLSQASYKSRSFPIWTAMAALGLALPLLSSRSHVLAMTGRPRHTLLRPPALPRAPPLSPFS